MDMDNFNLDDILVETEHKAERHHWVNTIFGTLSSSFGLTDNEEYNVLLRLGNLLDTLRIPERGNIRVMRADLATEVGSGYFADIADSLRKTNASHGIRFASGTDIRVPLTPWLDALTGLFTSSYHDFTPAELLVLRTELTYILESLGLHDEEAENPGKPVRVANFLPQDVIRHLTQAP